MKKHTVRIVGGDYRRTPIPVVDAPFLRPTPDRVRETLFNWLHHLWSGQFSDKRVLDLFAGTGALGFEAASRGAALVQMIETHPTAIKALRTLRERLQARQVRIHAGDAITAVQHMRDSHFDLILLDPPFGQHWLDQVWTHLPAILSPDALVYIESESEPSIPATFEIIRHGQAGKVHFLLATHLPETADTRPD